MTCGFLELFQIYWNGWAWVDSTLILHWTSQIQMAVDIFSMSKLDNKVLELQWVSWKPFSMLILTYISWFLHSNIISSVPLPGRFDLFRFLLQCSRCGVEVDLFSDVPSIIASRYWPGTVGTVTFLFDEDLFVSWDYFHLRMPGSSEYGFLNSLSDISKDNDRVNHHFFTIHHLAWRSSSLETKVLQNVKSFITVLYSAFTLIFSTVYWSYHGKKG